MSENTYQGWRTESLPVSVSMDPALMLRLGLGRIGVRRRGTNATDEDSFAVVAKVRSVTDWEALSAVTPGAVLGVTAEGSSIVTGRVRASEIETVRSAPGTISLKAARTVQPSLEATVPEIGLAAVAGAAAGRGLGAGCVVGVVDFGCAFAHLNFRTAARRSRLLALWHQAGSYNQHAWRYGRVFRTADLDSALDMAAPYEHLDYRPGPVAHGTHVLDIAAGNGLGSGVRGCAPGADLVFVDVAATDVPWTGPEAVARNVNLGDSAQVLEAIRFVFDQAGTRPCVVNLSLGTFGGPHDGTSLVEQGIDALVNGGRNRAVVIAAGNSHATATHAAGSVPAGGTADLAWEIPYALPSSRRDQELELWYEGSARLDVALLAPDGTRILAARPGDLPTVVEDDLGVVALAASRVNDPNNGASQLNLFLSARVPRGTWRVQLRDAGGTGATFDAWIERQDSHQSRFAGPEVRAAGSLGSISCGRDSIVVGSYDAHKPGLPTSYFSSAGPTRDGRSKPELGAPGHDVYAADSGAADLRGVRRDSGTSMAAPAVTGVAAVLLGEAAARGLSLSAADLRDLLVRGARPIDGTAGSWDPQLGFGRVSAANSWPLLPGAGANPAPTGGPVAPLAAAGGGGDGATTARTGRRKPKRPSRRPARKEIGSGAVARVPKKAGPAAKRARGRLRGRSRSD